VSVDAQSERAAPARLPDATLRGDATGEGDALPVLAEGPMVSEAGPWGLSPVSSPAFVPAVQAAAAAAGGFLAGAAVIGLFNRRHRRAARLVRRPRPRRASRVARARGTAKSGELVQVVGSRSLLVDVHLLAQR